MIIYTNQVLIAATSTAIWNRSKIAIAMAISVWVINVGFVTLGKFLLLLLLQDFGITQLPFFSAGVVQVGDRFQAFWIFSLNSSIATL